MTQQAKQTSLDEFTPPTIPAVETTTLPVVAEPTQARGHLVQVERAASPLMAGGMAAMTSPEQVDALVANVQARVIATKRLKAAMLSMTSPVDWVAQRKENGEEVPYLQGSGVLKLFNAFGVEVDVDPHAQVIEYPGGDFEVVFSGRVRAQALGDSWLFITGSRWSGDGFFTRGGKVQPDPGDVRKAALTNWYQNALTAVLGLENLTWEELADANIDQKKVTRIEYQKGKYSGKTGDGGAPTADTNAPSFRVTIKPGAEHFDTLRKQLKENLHAHWEPDSKSWRVLDTPDNRIAVKELGLTPEEGGS